MAHQKRDGKTVRPDAVPRGPGPFAVRALGRERVPGGAQMPLSAPRLGARGGPCFLLGFPRRPRATSSRLVP